MDSFKSLTLCLLTLCFLEFDDTKYFVYSSSLLYFQVKPQRPTIKGEDILSIQELLSFINLFFILNL